MSIIHTICASPRQKMTAGSKPSRKADAGLGSILPVGPVMARVVANFLKVLMAAGICLGISAPSAAFDMTGWDCTGNCGTLGANGVVPLAPPITGMPASTQYGWVSTKSGVVGAVPIAIGNAVGASITNGTKILSPKFTANAGEKLSFYFNYISSDGAGYADFAWVRLLDAAGNQKAILFTARTNQTAGGNTVPGFGMPLITGGTLTPATTPIQGDYTLYSTNGAAKNGTGPLWAPLGPNPEWSGTCYSKGCGYTGWIKMEYDVPDAGEYQLELGTANWIDQIWDSGMAFDGFMIGDKPIKVPCISDKFVPATPASNVNQISTDTVVYRATYDTANWTGHLFAYPYALSGDYVNLALTHTWDAATKLPVYSSRKIYTWRPSLKAGSPFAWASIDAGQQAMLRTNNLLETPNPIYYDGQKMVAYLSGDQSNESPNGDKYRNRLGLLGDIIGSGPVYVAKPELSYPDSFESAPYSVFKSSNASREPMIYVGANDGMLHAFRASDGVEQFAYIPSTVFPHLSDLAALNYGHQFYVDGTPLVTDAFWDSAWHTVLVGGLNAGGQGIYALDITDPGSFGAASVLWEFGDRQTATALPASGITNFDADLGYTYGTPYIARVRAGAGATQWVAIFGNGYKNTEADGSASTTGNAVLYVVNLKNGNLIKKLNTGSGTVGGVPNGLMSPTPVDKDGDGTVDYVYAGDLHGHMWKFDLTNNNPASWAVAFSGAPLFTASGPDGKPQPITGAPEVGPGPSGGLMVYFGTGKTFETLDNTVTSINTFYGVWDNMSSAVTPAPNRNKLAQQQLIEITVGGETWRAIANNNPVNWATQRGWFLDLTTDPNVPTTERSISPPQLNNGRIIFTSVIPSTSGDGCSVDGTSFLMELDPLTGGALPGSPFDVNDDGVFTNADVIVGPDGKKYVPVGKNIEGLASDPKILDDGDKQRKLLNTTEGLKEVLESKPGGSGRRWSWRDLSPSQ
ncbi:PilC/PilY family type IV pilus protein [Azonexus sp.]|jgi:hypothetical protein|uniref:pilus assembly protein n=1 Tax=Azonexus sp. TaxID=1872668 RepID=UPI00282FA853|nr:PilC/PilY family type IV pilus protein [Azonexus sp.]MDR1995503.1 NF038132 family protein [Azonexus sp.]